MTDAPTPSRKGLVLSLCLADLKHEWLLTLCMIMAVAAVLGPLLILFGLKYGTVETLRTRLINDPRNREIRPVSSHSFSQNWFDSMRGRNDVAFIIPTTRQLATAVELGRPKDKALSVDAVPTAPGDPLVLGNGADVPEPGQALLSAAAAEELKAASGDRLTLTVRRIKGGGFETGSVDVLVTDVLPLSASVTKAVFLPLSMVEAIEHFKDGQGVPAYGWPGVLPRAYPVFTDLLVFMPESLGPETEFRLISNTGFSRRIKITPAEARALCAVEAQTLADTAACYRLSTAGSPATAQNIAAVQHTLAGRKAVLYPFVDKATITLAGENGGAERSFTLLPATPFASVTGLDLPEKEPWLDDFKRQDIPATEWLTLLVPASVNSMEASMARITHAEHTLTFPVRLVPHPKVQEGTVKVPLRLLGTAGLLRTRPLTFDQTSSEFLVDKRGFAGFRLYARTLEMVAPLKSALEEEGIQVHTEAGRIDDVLRLDKYLSLIFWLIAAGSLVGGAACLVSNIYAGIERKRRDLAVLRLLGLSGAGFIRFPLYTAAFFAVSGFTVAFALYGCMSFVINTLFGAHLQTGESLCTLAWWHPLAALSLTLVVALLAGGVAALRAGKVDPADALRSE
ncbi:ABC transporter permease [Desulfovibrio sp. OttesenSCG-928-G15]|nr:ABC transporter permease [Desulfovibrio sp. OttesenSCG-928-G15]